MGAGVPRDLRLCSLLAPVLPCALVGCSKPVSFEPRLTLRRSWLAPDCRERGAEYQLVATVSHHGRSIGAGHYTADVMQPGGRCAHLLLQGVGC